MTTTPPCSAQTTVLIVDDQAPMRRLLHTFVGAAFPDLTLLQAADGASAMQACATHQPRLVLLDVSLPDGNGIELIAGIRTLFPRTQVIVVSHHAIGPYREHAREAGAFAYVVKANLYAELLPHVARVLGVPVPPGIFGGRRLEDIP
jgi:DNA-binding NarL/FixJ family response regulator